MKELVAELRAEDTLLCARAAMTIEAVEAENRELRTQDDPCFTWAFKLRAEAAEARIAALEEALTTTSEILGAMVGHGLIVTSHEDTRYGTYFVPVTVFEKIAAARRTLSEQSPAPNALKTIANSAEK